MKVVYRNVKNFALILLAVLPVMYLIFSVIAWSPFWISDMSFLGPPIRIVWIAISMAISGIGAMFLEE
jgi:hypothetical protein